MVQGWFVCVSVSLSVCVSYVCLFVCLFVWLLVCVFVCLFVCLSVCLSVFCNIRNNFWMDGPKWTKFLWLSRLVAANLRVCSTSAQSPQVRAGPAYSPFPCSLSPPWSLVLLVHVKPFWKAFDNVNQNVIADFLFWTNTCTGGLCGCGLQGRS